MFSHNFGNYILFPYLDCNRMILALNVDLHFDLDKILKRNNSDLNSFSVGIVNNNFHLNQNHNFHKFR